MFYLFTSIFTPFLCAILFPSSFGFLSLFLSPSSLHDMMRFCIEGGSRRACMWKRLHQASPQRRQGSWCTWLWHVPALRHSSPSYCCTCSSPIFVRCPKHSYRCEVCGGSGVGGGRSCSASPSSKIMHTYVSVMPGLCRTEAMRRMRKEMATHLAAARTSYMSLLARLVVARETSRQSLQSYTEWCTQAGARGRSASCRVLEERKGGTTSRMNQVSLDTLRNAVYALRFAIAAYALPYELGYFDSVWRSMQLRMPRHHRYVHATTGDQVAAIYRILSGGRYDPMLEVAYARYSASLGQPCFAVLLDHRTRRVVVTFRGTLSVADAIADVAGGYKCVRLCANSSALSDGMEKGFLTHLPSGFYANVMEAGSHLTQVLDSVRRQLPDYELMCVGHSLGAVEAILFHLLFLLPTQQGCGNVRTIAIAPAPCVEHAVVDKVNELLGEGTMTSWVYGLDAVARLQARSLRGLFYPPSLLSCSSPSSLATEEEVPLLSIPGRLLHIVADGTDVIDVPVEAPWRHEMVVGKRALLHHLPAVYGEALHKVLAEREQTGKESEGDGGGGGEDGTGNIMHCRTTSI